MNILHNACLNLLIYVFLMSGQEVLLGSLILHPNLISIQLPRN